MGKPIAVIAVVVVLLVALVVGGGCVNTKREAIRLRTSFAAQQNVSKTSHDTAWRIIQGKAGVASQYAEDFRKVFVGVAEGRNPGGTGTVMKWVQEHNPNFDSSLYREVSTSIEAHLLSFKTAQDRLLDIKREHDNLRLDPIKSVYLGNEPELVAQIVTSTHTEDAFSTGRDDTSANPFATQNNQR